MSKFILITSYASKKLPASGFSGILHLEQGVYLRC